MTTGKALDGKPYAGNPHVRFDEVEVASAATPRRGSLLYKTKTILAAMMAASFALGSLADAKTLTWNGASGASWEGANWLDGETPSEWVDGANAVFAAAATVSVPDTLTVSNLTTAAALTLTSPVQSSESDTFLSKTEYVLVFPGKTLAEVSTMSLCAVMAGKSVAIDAHADAFHFKVDGSSATAQFQTRNGKNIRCVKVAFEERTDGVYAKAIGACYEQTTLGVDLDATQQYTYSVSTGRTVAGYGLLNLRARQRLVITGETSFGGALTASNVAVEVTAPISQTWNNAITFGGGYLFVTGASSATVEKTFGITDTVDKDASVWLNDTQVLPNMALSRAEPVRIAMQGKNIPDEQTATPYHVKFNGATMTCQFQVFHKYSIKCVLVEFTQTGADVTARAVQSYLLAKDTKDVTATDLGWDFESGSAPDGKKITEYNIDRYAVKALVMRTVDAPSLTLGAANTIPDMVVDNAQAVFSVQNARPANLVARNGAQTIYAEGSANSGDSHVHRFESGSSMLVPVAHKTEGRAKYEFDASAFYVTQKNYINELVLRNGSHVRGGEQLLAGYYNASPTSTYASAGTSASSIETTISLMRHAITGSKTNTLVFATETDLTVSGKIQDFSTASYRGACIVKRGEATLTFSGTNTFAGRLTVEEGTLALGSDDALPASSPLTLAGGTISCGATDNATGALTLSGDAAINLGNGTLTFADSSGETWAPDATLNITGPEGWPVRSVRFGTSGAGLKASQLRRIRYNGSKVSLTDEGYLGGPRGLIISFH